MKKRATEDFKALEIQIDERTEKERNGTIFVDIENTRVDFNKLFELFREKEKL